MFGKGNLSLLLSLLCLIPSVVCSQGQATRKVEYLVGISPADVEVYRARVSSGYFSCIKSNERIPQAAINDNYCDCVDGSDEPGTAACMQGRFYCPGAGSVPEYVFSSRVNDGICDCCDGSDEWEGKVTCKNTCKEKEAQRLLNEKAHEERMASGRSKRARRVADASGLFDTLREEIQSLEKQQSELLVKEQLLADEKKSKDAKEAASAGEAAPTAADEADEGPDALSEYAKWANPADDEEGTIEERIQKVAQTLKSIASEISKTERLQNTDFGEENEYYALMHTCETFKQTEYTYRICPFGDAYQESPAGRALLGKFTQWVKPDVMLFDQGASCDHGPRKLELTFECGTIEQIIQVQEPSLCFYEARMTSPSACGKSDSKVAPHPSQGINEEDL